MESKRKDLESIYSSMDAIGMGRAAEIVIDEMKNARRNESDLHVIADSLKIYEEEVNASRENKLFLNSKLVERIYFKDFWDYKVRTVDRQLLAEVLSMRFMDNPHKNVILWGPSGTGKSWFNMVLATNGCRMLKRTKFMEFGKLMRELKNKKDARGKAFDTRLTYYSSIDLLCIDEFLFLESTEEYDDAKINIAILHEFINAIYKSKRTHLVISMQCDPYKMEALMKPKSIGQSIKGKILEESIVVHMGGEDLRLYDPKNEYLFFEQEAGSKSPASE
ncbi:MAG: ATP-binding protein [Candidatus Ornithospirochaeta sp.]